MRIFYVITAVSLVWLLSTSASAAPKFDPCNPGEYTPISERYKKGIFFEVSKCGFAPSHILGTMHSDLPQVKSSIPRSVYKFLDSASSASFELKNDPSLQVALVNEMYYPRKSPQNLQTTIGEKMYTQLREVLSKSRKDLDETIYNKMKPWAVGLLMQVPPDAADGVHLDLMLENFAKEKNIPVFGLETVGQQLSVFTDLSPAEQIEFLRDSIENFDESERMNGVLLSRYLEQDITAISQLAKESFALIKNKKLKAKLEKTLILARNKRMFKKALPKINQGAAFIAIGALHLPGDDGLLRLLEKQGYYIHVIAQ